MMSRCDTYIHFLQTAQADLHGKELDLTRLDGLWDMAYSQAFQSSAGHSIIFHVASMSHSILAQSLLCQGAEFDSSSHSLPALLLHEERITLEWSESEEGRIEIGEKELAMVGLNLIVGDKETLQYQLLHRYRVLLLTVHIHLSHARIRLFKFSVSNSLSSHFAFLTASLEPEDASACIAVLSASC